MTSQQAVTHADGAFKAPEALGIVKNCPHPEEAKKFADYLLSKKVVDEIFAKFSRRPARPDAVEVQGLPAVNNIPLLKSFDTIEASTLEKEILKNGTVSYLRSFFKVVVPVMLPGIVAGAIIMWVTTLAELSSTIVLYYGPWTTMTVEVFQCIGSGDFGPASAYATTLIISVLIPLSILNRVSGRDMTSSLSG